MNQEVDTEAKVASKHHPLMRFQSFSFKLSDRFFIYLVKTQSLSSYLLQHFFIGLPGSGREQNYSMLDDPF